MAAYSVSCLTETVDFFKKTDFIKDSKIFLKRTSSRIVSGTCLTSKRRFFKSSTQLQASSHNSTKILFTEGSSLSESLNDSIKEIVITPFIKGVQEFVAPPIDSFEVSTFFSRGTVVQVTCDGTSSFRVDEHGNFVLIRIEGFNHRIITRGRFNLPFEVNSQSFTWKSENRQLEVSWGSEAIVNITPAKNENEVSSNDWQRGLGNGFNLAYTVAGSVGNMAEILIDVKSSGMWFGGSHLMRQHWPLNTGSWEVGPHYPFDNGPHGLNTLVSSHWMTSNGLLVVVDPDNPFMHVGFNAPKQGPEDGFIQRSWGVGIQNMSKEYLPKDAHLSQGDGMLRLQARGDYMDFDVDHPMLDWKETMDECDVKSCSPMTLRLALCSQSNIRAAAQMALRGMPQPILRAGSQRDEVGHDFIRAPIWTTWAKYGSKVNQKKVLQFAEEIVSRGMQRSVMEVDDRWQSLYGDLTFDLAKFPDPAEMVRELHEKGFKVTLWVMPFVEREAEAFKEGAPKGYFCLDGAHQPGFFQWWNSPEACALDVTNPEATQWFVSRLKALQTEFGIDGFKFDAGEPCFLPRKFSTLHELTTPSEYTRLYIQNVASHFDLCEVRTGHRNQDLALFTRMGDRFSTWGLSNGLRSLIPTLLTSGLAGYPFCLPDMIGGNAYFGQKPDMELMVRWAQVNALMPAMQFSIAPWDLSKEADELCQQALQMRQEFLQTILKVAKEAGLALEPMCKPMWWLDPEDEETYAIKDQFVVGNDVIVAPVVYQGHVTRDIYLTQGLWTDLLNPNFTYNGGQWVEGFDAPLNKLPIFIRVLPAAESAI